MLLASCQGYTALTDEKNSDDYKAASYMSPLSLVAWGLDVLCMFVHARLFDPRIGSPVAN